MRWIQSRRTCPDLFITGANLPDMDGIEHLERSSNATCRILVRHSHKDRRTFDMLRKLRFDGIYDGKAEESRAWPPPSNGASIGSPTSAPRSGRS